MRAMALDTDLDVAAAALVLVMRGEGDFDQTMLRTIHVELARRVGALSGGSAHVDELVDAVLVRFVQAARRRRVEPATAGAYLARSVQNAVVDEHRASARRPIPYDEELMFIAPSDDDIARLLAGHAAHASVVRGLSQVVSERRFTVVRVVTEWLQQAELTGSAPSSRAVGVALDLSHTTVNAALSEFRDGYLPKPGSET